MLTYDSGGFTAQSIAVSDVNGDGRRDVVVGNVCADVGCNGNGSVGVLLNGRNSTSTLLSSNLNPSIYGQKVAWTATVATTGSSMPTGKVKFTWSIYTIGPQH